MRKKNVIVGAGVMGRVLAHSLENKGYDVEVYDSAHSCALNSMPFVSLFGIEEGKSELGDLLLRSFKEFEQYQLNFKNPGIKKVKHFVLYPSGGEKYEKRFGPSQDFHFKELGLAGKQLDSYLIHPETALNHLYDISKIQLKYMDPQKTKENGTDANYFYCTSSLSNNTWDLSSKSKVVAGSYLVAQDNLGNESFIMSSEYGNLIYDHERQLIHLGATTEKDEYCLPDLKKLLKIKSFYLKYFSSLSQVEFHLGVGLRLKGKKRMPRFEKIRENEYLLDSFYKNGWSLPFLFVRKVDEVLS